MCGIGGIYEYGSLQPVDEHALLGMLHVMRHRGPDDEGMYVHRHVGIGMRRLSIIDLAGGRQPIWNESRSVVVVFNGEIYNYVELRQALQSRGHHFATESDTEVIVHLYEEAGDECVHSLRGMFAFALWDINRQRLLIARDRLGIKPLYYQDKQGTLLFGSEIKVILAHPETEASLDNQALSHYLSLKYVPAPLTMFEGIRALPPGHILSCERSGVTIRPYWRLSYAVQDGRRMSDADYAAQLDDLLRSTVRLHLRSDVPFGAFLSGGLDSSTIVAFMSELLDRPVKTFSVGFDGQAEEFSELPYARLVAKRYETEHREILIRPSDLTGLSDKIIWHLDQPIADNACLANYMVSELASREVKMVLTGEGGDELFAGYARYVGEQFSRSFQRIPEPLRKLAWRTLDRLPGLRRPKLAMFALCQSAEHTRLTNWFALLNSEMKEQILSEEFKQGLPHISSDGVFADHLSQTDATDALNRMLYVDTKLWLPDDLLARGDKMSMAVSLEARVPLLDHHLVEFAASLPPRLKLNGLTRKYLLRKVASRRLPPAIIERKKQGFPMPFSLWFRKEARSFMRDLLSSDTIRRRGLLNPAGVETMLAQHEAGTADHSPIIWGLISLELWHRVFLDSSRASRQHSMSGAHI